MFYKNINIDKPLKNGDSRSPKTCSLIGDVRYSEGVQLGIEILQILKCTIFKRSIINYRL